MIDSNGWYRRHSLPERQSSDFTDNERMLGLADRPCWRNSNGGVRGDAGVPSISSPKRLGVAASVLLPVLLLLATLPRNVEAAAPTFSVGPLAGQYYAYDSTEGWLVDQGSVSIGAAVYVEAYRYADFGFQLVGFYAAQTGNVAAPGLSGVGVAVERNDAPTVGLAWAYETGSPFAEYDSHGVIATLGVDFNLFGSKAP